jgi:hypothetical protein
MSCDPGSRSKRIHATYLEPPSRASCLPTAILTEVAFTRCARPTLMARAISTYTVLGLAGYVLASLAGSALAIAWDLSLGERLLGRFFPPIAFLVTVTIARVMVGRERIVFYQTAFAGVLATAVVAALAGVHVARLVDLATSASARSWYSGASGASRSRAATARSAAAVS